MEDLIQHELLDNEGRVVALGYELFGDGVIQKVGLLDEESGEVNWFLDFFWI